MWKRPLGQHKILIVSGVAVFALASMFAAEYRLYAFTIAWHCVHQDTAKIGGYEASLPTLWWEEKSEDYDTFRLRRAAPSSTFPPPVIIVRPALSGATLGSDQEVLESMKTLIAAKATHPALGSSSSLIILGAKAFPLYCEKIDTRLLGIDLSSRLSCEAAKVPYIFTFDGLPNREKEAESILESLK